MRQHGWVIAVIGFMCLTGLAHGATVDWIEPAGGQFGAGANWDSDPTVPGSDDDVYFRVTDAPEYMVLFDDPAVNPTNKTLTVEAGNRVTMAMGEQSYETTGNLVVTGSDGARLVLKGGTIGVGGEVSAGADLGDGYLAVSNEAVLTMAGALRCNGSGEIIITGGNTEVEATSLWLDQNRLGNSRIVVDDGAILRIVTGQQYIYGSYDHTSMLLVTNGATFSALDARTNVGLTEQGGRITVVGNNSTANFRTVNLWNYSMLDVGAGGTVAMLGGNTPVNASDNSLVTGTGKITSQSGSFRFYLNHSSILAPGVSGIGTLTIEDATERGVQFLSSNVTLRVSLAGTAVGEYGRLEVTRDKHTGTPRARFEQPGVAVEVTLNPPYLQNAKVGDTFDLIEADDFTDGGNNTIDETHENFPGLDILTPKVEGVLSIETVDVNRKALRLTLTSLPPKGTVFMLR